jgi:hypothetical protein
MDTPLDLGNLLRLLESAESSLKSARALISEASPGAVKTEAHLNTDGGKAYEAGENQIVEGTFDGQNMIGPNEKNYPVPANYASKSKLVEGDRLKLTILPNGTFLYKQIAPVERVFVRGTLLKEDGQFKVVAGSKTYRVLLASVTYYKGNPGDEVTLITPANRDSSYGTIEAVIPAIQGEKFNKEEAF